MAFEILPGESSLTDCPRVMGTQGYQAAAGTSAALCLGDDAPGGGETWAAKFVDIFCPTDVIDAQLTAGSGDCSMQVVVPDSVIDRPGIYRLQWSQLDGNSRPTEIHSALLSVEPSLWTLGTEAAAGTENMVTIDRIRIQLRDGVPGAVIDGYEFSVDEIVHSILRPIEFWNSTPPPTTLKFTARQFPYTYQWMEGTIANLLRISSTYLLRQSKKMNYSGGLVTDDRDKHSEYMRLAEGMWSKYERFVLEQKQSLYVNQGVGILSGRGVGRIF